MIKIDRIWDIPDCSWAEKSGTEYHPEIARELVLRSQVMWQICSNDEILAVAGLLRYSLVTPPWAWFLFTWNFAEHLQTFRVIMREVDYPVMTLVEDGYKEGMRFAKVFGWRATGEQVEQLGKLYNVMRRG
jgi:hypothetical protein